MVPRTWTCSISLSFILGRCIRSPFKMDISDSISLFKLVPQSSFKRKALLGGIVGLALVSAELHNSYVSRAYRIFRRCLYSFHSLLLIPAKPFLVLTAKNFALQYSIDTTLTLQREYGSMEMQRCLCSTKSHSTTDSDSAHWPSLLMQSALSQSSSCFLVR